MRRARGSRIRSSERADLHRVSSAQFGVISWRQMMDLEISKGRVDSWIRSGQLHPVFTGSYAVGRPIDSFQSVGMAAVLSAGPGALLSDLSAAAAYGLMPPTSKLDVCRPAGNRWHFRGYGPHRKYVVNARVRAVGEAGSGMVGPIPVCAPWRVLVDLAGRMNPWEFRRVFLEAGRSGLLTAGCLDDCVQLTRGRRGRVRLLELIDLWGSESGTIRSGLEGEFRLFCGERCFIHPDTNQRVAGYEVDAVWWEQRVAVELDSRRYHRDGAAFEADRTKGNRLVREGFTLLRVTDRMLHVDHERAGLADTLRSLGIPQLP